ncbi:MAG TPA: hypothetical protein EYG57_13005 [Planctomycetes bacterium]|nr:hypothetical protein [Verrucomicrobiales bacterium]HIM30450.1 hypothetical protein [Planctomycetota bacterium]
MIPILKMTIIIWVCLFSSGLGNIDLPAVENLTPDQILKYLGALGRNAGTKTELAAYDQHFNRTDRNGDGRLSREEYVDKGTYLNPQSRAGIFRASDTDQDGSVSREEYVVNRRITDEAKAIMARVDANGDGRVTRKEFIEYSGSEDEALAITVFEKLDTNRDGVSITPEFLRVWGVWARAAKVSNQVEAIVKQASGASASRAGGRSSGRRRGPPSRIGPGGGVMPDLLSRRGIQAGDNLPNVTIHSDAGMPKKLHELIGNDYTVIVGGCLTCPQFLSRYPSIEAVARDYSPKGVRFYYLYRALAHPENNGYVEPFDLDERLMHIAEAKGKLKTRVPWIADNMDNELKAAMGNINNPAFLLRSGGEIVYLQSWSDGEGLRKELAEILGPVDPPTLAANLGLPEVSGRTRAGRPVLPRVEVPDLMVPLLIVPGKGSDPFYVKLRAEAEPSVIESGSGKIYLGFHVDPIHDVHWNNLVAPMKFMIETSDGTEVTPSKESAAKVAVDADTDPREFLVSIVGANPENPFKLTVDYFACSDEEGWCRKIVQEYTVQLKRDPFGGGVMGRSFLPGRGFGGGRPSGGYPGGRPERGGFRGGPPGSAGGGPPDPTVLFERFDRNEDGIVTESETPEFLWNRISSADKNKDGLVSLDELKTYRSSGQGRGTVPSGNQRRRPEADPQD